MRLIDAEPFEAFSKDGIDYEGDCLVAYVAGMEGVLEAIDSAPAIDPIHAAGGCYCRECGHKDSNACPAYDPPMNRTSMRIKFCNCGKRKDAQDG